MTDHPRTMELEGYDFAYYPRVGGIVISIGPVVIDAGIIGTPGPITRDRLTAYARHWSSWRTDRGYGNSVSRFVIGNRPAKPATDPPTQETTNAATTIES